MCFISYTSRYGQTGKVVTIDHVLQQLIVNSGEGCYSTENIAVTDLIAEE